MINRGNAPHDLGRSHTMTDSTPTPAPAAAETLDWAAKTLEAFGVTPEELDEAAAAAGTEEAIVTLLDEEYPWVCSTLDLDAYDLAIEWVHHHPGITVAEVEALIEAGNFDPRTTTR
jgi:hypothetical protein